MPQPPKNDSVTSPLITATSAERNNSRAERGSLGAERGSLGAARRTEVPAGGEMSLSGAVTV